MKEIKDDMDHILVYLNEARPYNMGPPQTHGSWWRGLTPGGPKSGEGNGKPLQCSCLEKPMNSTKRQKGH